MAVKSSSKTVNLKKVAKKHVKKKPWLILLVFVIALGAVGGFFAADYLTKNDTFEIIGEQTIYLNVGQKYEDEGAKVISFGRDVSHKIKSENTIDESQPGEYYIKYSIDDFRFGKVCRYRYVIVQEVGNEE
ncbi:MAG: DUF5011 domain-containing protein [Clostridia bacterium]|nr:DUF5011 domain-containing protein [Clostridia bacterium]